MLKVISDLIADVEIAGNYKPSEPISPHEVEVGEMSEDSKKIYILLNQTEQRVRDIIMDSISAGKSSEELGTFEELKKSKELLEVLIPLQWYLLKREFNLFSNEYDTIGVRKGWKVVCFDSPAPRNILDFLGGLDI